MNLTIHGQKSNLKLLKYSYCALFNFSLVVKLIKELCVKMTNMVSSTTINKTVTLPTLPTLTGSNRVGYSIKNIRRYHKLK